MARDTPQELIPKPLLRSAVQFTRVVFLTSRDRVRTHLPQGCEIQQEYKRLQGTVSESCGHQTVGRPQSHSLVGPQTPNYPHPAAIPGPMVIKVLNSFGGCEDSIRW